MTNNYNPDPAYQQGVHLPPPPAAPQPQNNPDVAIAQRALALEAEGTEKAKWGVAGCLIGLAIVIWGLAAHRHGIVPLGGSAFCVGAWMIFQGGKLATEAEELADQIQDEPTSPLVTDTSDFVTLADGRVVTREHAEGLARADAARVREGYQPIHDRSQSQRPDSTPREGFTDYEDALRRAAADDE